MNDHKPRNLGQSATGTNPVQVSDAGLPPIMLWVAIALVACAFGMSVAAHNVRSMATRKDRPTSERIDDLERRVKVLESRDEN